MTGRSHYCYRSSHKSLTRDSLPENPRQAQAVPRRRLPSFTGTRLSLPGAGCAPWGSSVEGLSRGCARTGEKRLLVQRAQWAQCSDPFPDLTRGLLWSPLPRSLLCFFTGQGPPRGPSAGSRKLRRDQQVLTMLQEGCVQGLSTALRLCAHLHLLPSFHIRKDHRKRNKTLASDVR